MQRRHGFTLVEVLVAIAVLSVLSVMAWRAIDGLSRTGIPVPGAGFVGEMIAGLRPEHAPRQLTPGVEKLEAIAPTGVDYVAVGGLTHSAPVLDVGADLRRRLAEPWPERMETLA